MTLTTAYYVAAHYTAIALSDEVPTTLTLHFARFTHGGTIPSWVRDVNRASILQHASAVQWARRTGGVVIKRSARHSWAVGGYCRHCGRLYVYPTRTPCTMHFYIVRSKRGRSHHGEA